MPVRHRLVQLLGVLGVHFLFLLYSSLVALQAAGREGIGLGVGGIRLETQMVVFRQQIACVIVVSMYVQVPGTKRTLLRRL
jgi:hypothetical protein